MYWILLVEELLLVSRLSTSIWAMKETCGIEASNILNATGQLSLVACSSKKVFDVIAEYTQVLNLEMQ